MIVNQTRTVVVESISVSTVYNLTIEMGPVQLSETVEVVGETQALVDVAPGPAATFNTFEVDTAPAFNRDIVEVYGIDPRINIDNEAGGFQVNCAGKHPRFNSVTLDGVSYNDRFGLNSNGYNTAVGMPFPFDGVAQVAVEMAPIDVTYGGFSACNINAVTKSGTNTIAGNAFYEHTSDDLRRNIGESTPSFTERNWGASFGGPVLKDKLFFFGAYENSSQFVPLAMGYAGSGNGVERPWLSQADFDRIQRIATDVYGYDTGGLPSDGSREADKVLLKLNWSINQQHNLAGIFNYFDGFEDRASDDDSNEFEFANHFYQKGAKSKTFTVRLNSQWTNQLSSELFLSRNTMDDSQITVGPQDFGEFQISIGGQDGTVYMGADDSRQANALNTKSNFFKLAGQYLAGRHVVNGGYEREGLTIFNQFVQHARGGEYRNFDDSQGNPAYCAALDAQGRFDDPGCGLSGIDRFELGRPSRIYYGNGGGTNDPVTASAEFTNALNSLYLQDSIFFDKQNLTVVAGLRYEFFSSNDRPVFNQTFTAENGGLRNDENIDGLSLWMPRLGATWSVNDDLVIRAGIGRFSGGNPNVWLSNAWSNDGLTNVQTQLRPSGSLFDGSIPLIGNQPGYESSVPQSLFDQVANTTPDNASDSFLVLISPDYRQPNEWKFSVGGTYRLPGDVQADFDYLHTELKDSAYYVDLSQEVVGTTLAGGPIYAYSNGRDNFMLTNSDQGASSDIFSVMLRKFWNNGLDMYLGYSYIRAEDISPMTSSVAGSNFDNLALIDINNPVAGTTNYRVPQPVHLPRELRPRLLLELGDAIHRLRLPLRGPAPELRDGLAGPRGRRGLRSAPALRAHRPLGPQRGLRRGLRRRPVLRLGRIGKGSTPGSSPATAPRPSGPSASTSASTRSSPPGGNTRGRFYLKMYNVGNFLNEDWGQVWDAQFFSVQVVDSDVNDAGQYVFNSFTDRSISDLIESRSNWEVRLGVGFRF